MIAKGLKFSDARGVHEIQSGSPPMGRQIEAC